MLYQQQNMYQQQMMQNQLNYVPPINTSDFQNWLKAGKNFPQFDLQQNFFIKQMQANELP